MFSTGRRYLLEIQHSIISKKFRECRYSPMTDHLKWGFIWKCLPQNLIHLKLTSIIIFSSKFYFFVNKYDYIKINKIN